MIRYAGEKITVVLLDDHPMIRLSLEMAASHHPDMQITGSFSHSHELLTWLQNNSADVLVLDYILGGDELDGLSLIKQILSRHPKLKILLSSSMESLAVIRAAFMSGIQGYISKREEAQAYFEAIRVIDSGLRFIPDNIESELSKIPLRKRDGTVLDGPLYHANGEKLSRLDTLLSPREAEVIRCFLDGMQVIEIAEKLKRSRKTISGHKQSGMRKLGLSTDLELFKYREHLF